MSCNKAGDELRLGLIRQLRTGPIDCFISLMATRRHDCSKYERDRRNARAGNSHTMNRSSRSWGRIFAGAGLGLFVLDGPALAADMPLKAPPIQSVFDWTGIYVGAHTGYSRGSANAVLSDPASSAASNSFSGVIGDVQAGYNVRLPS